MPDSITMTPTEASKLFEEKIETLRESRNKAELEAREAVARRDKTRDEVTTLQQEKSRAIEEIDQAKQDAQRIRETLAEHRANVEASLAAQESKAREVIQQAASDEAAAKASAATVKQRHEQLVGIKQTLRADLSTIVSDVATMVQKTQDALDAIPE